MQSLKVMGCQYLFEILLLILLDIYPGVGLLDYMVVPFFIIFRNLHTVFHSGYTNYIPTHTV